MYPSGLWKGFWQQELWGRQPMEQFELHFSPDGRIIGQGRDVVGLFVFRGWYDTQTGEIQMTKQYLEKHAVEYRGRSDGEGKIVGTWSIDDIYTGPFSLQPVISGEEPIEEFRK